MSATPAIAPAAAKPAAMPATAAAPAKTAPAAAPTSTQSPVPAGQPAAVGEAGKGVLALLETTKAIDTAWTSSALTAQAAVTALGKDGQLSPAAQSSLARIAFTGKVLGETLPKEAKLPALPAGVTPADAIVKAEQGFITAVTTAAQKSSEIGKTLPKDAPEDVVKGYMVAHERITDAIYAVKFGLRIAPPPAPPAEAKPATGAAPAPASAPAAAAPAPALKK